MSTKKILLGLSAIALLALSGPADIRVSPLGAFFKDAQARELVKMSPRIREYESAVVGGGITIRELRSLIPKMAVFDDDMRDSGELIDFFESAIGKPGGRVEAVGLEDYRDLSRFDIYRPCTYINNPNGWRDLGCLTLLTAQATRVALTKRTDILRIDAAFHAIFRGQRIVPRVASSASSISKLYRIDHAVSGKIVEIVEGLAAGAQYRVVVVNLGRHDKVGDGAVLTIYRNNENAEPFLPDLRPKWRHVVSTEVIPIGQLVLFDVFEKASLALVLRSEREVVLDDFVRN